MSPRRSATTSTEDFARKRERMVERQLRGRGIEDERVLRAMGEVPREAFLPEDVRGDAYRDGAVPIGEGQTMSQPWIVACMTALVEPRGDERTLEVGTGSGYGAAVLSSDDYAAVKAVAFCDPGRTRRMTYAEFRIPQDSETRMAATADSTQHLAREIVRVQRWADTVRTRLGV